MTNTEYHRYATLFDSAVAVGQYITLMLFGEVTGEALREWAQLRDLAVREHERVAPNSTGDAQITWRIIDVSDFASSCHITVQVQIASEPIVEAA